MGEFIDIERYTMKLVKKIGKAFAVAFSIYSKIPMPRFNWESEDMKYHLCFFPWVGAVIGLVEAGWYQLCIWKGIATFPFVMVAMAIPLLITGGFHVDGFMDTCDALHSYQDREKKLEILKDPHIGAFAVICLALYMLLAAGASSLVYEGLATGTFLESKGLREVLVLSLGFVLSRALSGLSVVCMQGAKKKGMLQTASDTAGKKTVRFFLLLQAVLCGGAMLFCNPILGGVTVGMSFLTFAYYAYMSKKQFGGITGDLAGYFVTMAELMQLVGAAVYFLVM